MRSPAGLALCMGLWGTAAPAAAQDPAAPEPGSDPRAVEQAKLAAKAGSDAFRRGDYKAALAEFERALALRPSPKLHFNIAVCHHRLIPLASDEQEASVHREQAIDAYNRYLDAKPDAPDRHEVADFVRELGGQPATYHGLKRAFDRVDEEMPTVGEPVPEQAQSDPGPGTPVDPPVTAPRPRPRPSPTERYHARFYLAPHLGLAPQMFRRSVAEAVAGAGALLIEGKAGGYLDRRGRALLGIELGAWGAAGTEDQLALSSWHAGAAFDYDFHVGSDHRVVLAVGAMGGFGRQAMRTTATAKPPLCTLGRENERLVAVRHGGVVGARFNVGVLVGPRRWHEIDFSLHPALGIYGRGSQGEDCATEPSPHPFTNLGVVSPQVTIWAGFGYAFRF